MAAGAASITLVTPARAQTTGGITGNIVDATNQTPIKDAVVIAQSPALQGEQTAVTDDKGSFEITLLPAGVYTLTVQREGYQPFSQQGLKVNLDKTIRVKLQVVPDSFKGEQVEIVAQKPTIAVTSTTTGGTVTKEQMSLVPFGRNARNFEAVATSIPGVQTDLYGIGFSVNGSGAPESNYIIDGVNVTNPAFGTQGTTLIQDFVQEVDVKTGGYQAEYGRSTGGIINVVTKSGGNEFHGSVFANWSPYEAPRRQLGRLDSAISSQVKQNFNLDFGAELGGPIIKDKLWFFAGFAPQLVSLNIDRIVSALTSTTNGTAAVDSNGNLIRTEVDRHTYTNTSTSYQFTGKLTYLLNENHNLALAVYGNPTTTTGANGTVFGNEGSNLFDLQGGSTDVSLRYSGKLLNKSMLVEATAAYHHQINKTNVIGVGGASAAQLRDTPVITWRQVHNLLDPYFQADPTTPDNQKPGGKVYAACQIQANGFDPCPVNRYVTGGAGFLGDETLNRIAGVLKLSNFVELAGHHQFKYGVDASQDSFDQNKTYSGGVAIRAIPTSSTNTPATQFQYYRAYGHQDPAHPGTPAFAANAADGGIRLAGDVISTNTKNVSIAAFAQDTWSIMDKVVLDLGVRMEKQLMYADSKTVDANGNPVTGAQIDLTNVMPRVGLIYDFTQRGLSKVYASFGRFYEYIPLDLADRALSAETQVVMRTNALNCKNPNDPRTCAILPGGGGGGATYGFTGGAAGTAVDPNLQGQYADEYAAGVQYQVYRDISVGVDFVHKQLGRVIEDMSVNDGNTYFLSNPGEPGHLGYQAVTASGVVVNEPPPRRLYDAVTLSVNKNFSENWLVSASYTYSSFRGNYPGLFSPRGDGGAQLDPNILSEYDLVSLLPNKEGPLPGDVPNAFKVNGAYVYEVSPALNLNFGANLRAQQGQPINYLGAHPLYGSGEAYILPRGSAGREPWTWTLDLRAAAQYKLTKDYNLGVSVDLFNVTDNRETVLVDENYTFSSVAPIVNGKVSDLQYLKTTDGTALAKNANFLQPIAYQVPFSARFGAKLSF